MANTTELLAQLLEQQDGLKEELAAQQATQDELFVLVSAIGILGLQSGFAMLEAGAAKAKNTKAILMKNLVDFSSGMFAWYALGYGLYEGDSKFVSGAPWKFFSSDEADFAIMVQQFGFAVTGTTIMSGSVMGRMKFELYLLVSILFTGVVYPVAAHWAWASNGFLGADPFNYKDFAGSGVVHMIGGIYGLVGAWLCGPRVGRFIEDLDLTAFEDSSSSKKRIREVPGHSSTLYTLGVFQLVLAWMFFNAGSSGGTDSVAMRDASRALLNSLLSMSTCSIIVMVITYVKNKTYNLPEFGNAMLAGLVAVTGPCGYVEPFAACIIGAAAAIVYTATSRIVLRVLFIDDALDAFAVHGACGFLGIVMTGVFDKDDGLFYSGKASSLLGQLMGGAVLAGWALITSLVIFFLLNKIFGLAVDEDDQLLGMDIKYHGGYAFPEFSSHDVAEYNRTREAAGRKMRYRYDSESFDYGSAKSGDNSESHNSENAGKQSSRGSFQVRNPFRGTEKSNTSQKQLAASKTNKGTAPQEDDHEEEESDNGYV